MALQGEAMALTDTALRELHRRAKRGEKVPMKSDGGGLNFQDGKYWRFTFYFAGKKKRLALGVYPDVSLKAARQARDKARELLAQGIDPGAQRKADRAEEKRRAMESAVTFELVAREWYEKKTLTLSSAYRKQKLQRMEKHLFPYVGHVPMASLDLPDLVAALEHLHGRPDMGKRVAELAGQICRYARVMKYVLYDVSAGLTETLPDRPPQQHRPALKEPARIGALLRAIDEYPGDVSTRYALRILPYVFVRSQEIRGAKWEEIDFDKALWVIPAGRMKMKAPHTVPLARQVVKLFLELYEWTGHGALVFPSPFSATRCISDMALLNALRRLGYGKDEMCVHGFRGMASTLLNECGKYRHDVIEAQLAHSERNKVRGAYNHAQYLPERKNMMQEWADWLDRLRAGE